VSESTDKKSPQLAESGNPVQDFKCQWIHHLHLSEKSVKKKNFFERSHNNKFQQKIPKSMKYASDWERLVLNEVFLEAIIEAANLMHSIQRSDGK
jgi:hypothetical protein